MDNYTLESFINFCDDYQIANESFSSIKSKLIAGFSKLVIWLDKKVKTMKDSRVKSGLLKLLNRAKAGLAKSNSLNDHNPEIVQELQKEMAEIKEEANKVNDNGNDITAEFKDACAKGKPLRVRIMLKDMILLTSREHDDLQLNKYVSYASSHIKDLWVEDDGETSDEYNMLVTMLVNNFSKKKWNKAVKIARDKYGK